MDNKMMINYLLKLVGSIEQLFFFVKNIDWDGNTEESEQLKEIFNALAHSDVKSIEEKQERIGELSRDLAETRRKLRVATNELEQMKKQKEKLQRKFNTLLKENISMLEHIKEMHKKYD